MVAIECNALRIALRSKVAEAAGAPRGVTEGVDTNPRTLASAVEMFAPLARYRPMMEAAEISRQLCGRVCTPPHV